MSFKNKTICIFLIMIMMAVLTGCSGQTAVPTATVVPTAEEPTSAPTEEPAVVETATEEAETVTEETPVEEAETTKAGDTTEEAADSKAEAENPTADEPAAESTETEETETNTKSVETEVKADDEVATTEAVMTEEAVTTEETQAETETTAEETESFAAIVDGEGISIEEFEQMAAFNRYQYLNMYAQYAQMYAMYGLPIDSLDEQVKEILGEDGKERLGSEVIDQLTYDKVLQIEAANTGLTVTDEDVYEQLKSMFSYEDPVAEEEGPMGLDSFNVDPVVTQGDDDKNAAFKAYAETILAQNYGDSVSFDFIKKYAANILLDNRMFAEELENRVFEAEMVSARHILVEDEETAKDIIARLEAGEEWDALASENSLDTANKDTSGDLGWFGRGQMVAEFEEAAFALEPGQISEPVKTSFGYHIIASDGKEIRPLSGSALQAAETAAYDEWTLNLRSKHDIQSYPETWLSVVPMEPAFVSLNTAPADEEAVTEPEEAVEQEATAEPAENTEAAAVVEAAETEPESTEKTDAVPASADTSKTEAEATEKPVTEEVLTEETAIISETTAETEIQKETEPTAVETTEQESETEKQAADVIDEVPAAKAEKKTAGVVATLNGETDIYEDDFVQMAVFNRYQMLASYNQYVQYANIFGFTMDDINSYYENLMGEDGKEQLGASTIDQLLYAKMLDYEAAEMGVSVSTKDAVDQMKAMFGFETENDEAETSLGLDSFNLEADLPADDTEDDDFRDYVEMDISMAFNDKVSYDFYLEYIRHSLLENAIVDKLMENYDPNENLEEQVNARHILVAEEETAKEVLAKLEAGEEWDALAAQYSQDPGNKDFGGSLGWFGRGVMVGEFEDAAFALEPGEISEPIQTSFGWHIIASDGKEMRPSADEEAVRETVFNEWYESLNAKYNQESYPDIWLPLVPTEPVFTPIEIEASDENSSIPTFHIVTDEDGVTTVEEEGFSDSNEQPADKDEEEVTISNTEQEFIAYTINNDAENEAPAAEEVPVKNAEEESEIGGIQNTEQEETALILSNDKENK